MGRPGRPGRLPRACVHPEMERNPGHLFRLAVTVAHRLCLAAAKAYEWAFPEHHGYWVAVTLLIVVQRNLRTSLGRALEQALGTVLGIALISLFMLASPSLWAVIGAIGVLAAGRAVLAGINHAAYATAMTPLVILLLDFGHPASWGLVFDRLAATITGCVLALTLGYVGWSRLAPPIPLKGCKPHDPLGA